MDAAMYLDYKNRVREKCRAVDIAIGTLFAGLAIGGMFGYLLAVLP